MRLGPVWARVHPAPAAAGGSREKEAEGNTRTYGETLLRYSHISSFLPSRDFKNCFYPLKCKPFITNTNTNFLAAG